MGKEEAEEEDNMGNEEEGIVLAPIADEGVEMKRRDVAAGGDEGAGTEDGAGSPGGGGGGGDVDKMFLMLNFRLLAVEEDAEEEEEEVAVVDADFEVDPDMFLTMSEFVLGDR